MLIVSALMFAFAGWAALALAMEKHHRHVRRRAAGVKTRIGLRLAGAAGLMLAFAACVAAFGWSIGPVAWFGVLGATALVFVLLLPHMPRATALGGVIAAIIGLVLAALG